MKKIDLKTVCDSALKDELEKRGYYVQYVSKNIDSLKGGNKTIEVKFDSDCWTLGETREFSEEKFEKTIKKHHGLSLNYPIDIHKEYFRLNLSVSITKDLLPCRKGDDGAIEFWRI